MKKILFILLLMLSPTILLTPICFADVDLLVQGFDDRLKNVNTTEWALIDYKDYWSQTHRGEIIDVFPVGLDWGKRMIPPVFLKITVIGVTTEQVKEYLEPLVDSVIDTTFVNGVIDFEPQFVKQRRWHFTQMVVDSAQALWINEGKHLIITKQQAKNFIVEYNIKVIKQKIQERLRE